MFGSQTLKRLTLTLLGASLLALAAAAPASAAWSDSFISPSSLTNVADEPPVTAIDADGDSFYAWTRSDGVVQGRTRSAAGSLGKVLTLSKTGLVIPEVLMLSVAANGEGDALFAWETMNTTGTRYLIQGRYLTAEGQLGPIETFVSQDKIAGEIVELEVALDRDGNGVIAYQQEGLNDGAQLLARTRSAAGRLGRTKRISAGGIDSEIFDPEVEMDNGGEAVFVWQQDSPLVEGKIQARVLSPTGSLGQTKTLAPSDAMLGGDEGEGEFTQLAVNPRGDAAFTWARKIIATGKDVIEGRVLTDDDVLKKTVRLSASDSEVTESEVDIANDGASVFSWGQKDLVSGKFRFTGRALSATNRLGELKALSGATNDVFHGHVGIDANGDALFVWQDKEAITSEPVLKSRTLTAAGQLARAVPVAAIESDAEGLELAVAARGDAVASWLNASVKRIQAAFGP